MLDFNFTSVGRGGIIYCALFYFFMLWRYGKLYLTWDNNHKSSKFNNRCFILLFFAFVITSWTNGDWFHYQSFVKEYSPLEPTGLEDFYNFIIAKTHQNYLIFRCVVWGLATFFLYKFFKVSNVNPYMAMMFLFVIFIDYFDYSRSALGVSCYMLGLSMLVCDDDDKKRRRLLGLILILCSVFFHRSMAVMIFLTPFCLVPINKKTIFFIVVALFLLFSVTQNLFTSLITDLMDSEDEGIAMRAQLYGNADNEALISADSTLLGWLVGFWKWSIPYLLFIVVSIFVFKYGSKIDKPAKMIYRYTFSLIATATLIYFMKFGHAALFYRIYNMSYVAITLLICYLYQKNIMPSRTFRRVLFYSGFYMVFTFLYRCYIGA